MNEVCVKLFVKNVRVCSHRSQIEGITFYLLVVINDYESAFDAVTLIQIP